MTTTQGPPTAEKKALIDAYDDVLKADAVKRDHDAMVPRARRKWPLHPVAVLSLVILLSVAAYLAVSRPAWLFDRGMPPESVAIQEASLRLAMAQQYQRVERFRQQHGRLPDGIAETGHPLQGVTYEKSGSDQYVLRGTNGSISLILRSTDSVRAFVANSYVMIQRRGQR